MAKRTVIELLDDISGESLSGGNGRTVTFAFDGATYEVDLTNSHIDELREALKPYIAAGRRTGGRQRGASAGAAPASSRRGRAGENAAIREWANSQGIQIGSRGRISDEIRQAYESR